MPQKAAPPKRSDGNRGRYRPEQKLTDYNRTLRTGIHQKISLKIQVKNPIQRQDQNPIRHSQSYLLHA